MVLNRQFGRKELFAKRRRRSSVVSLTLDNRITLKGADKLLRGLERTVFSTLAEPACTVKGRPSTPSNSRPK